MARVLTAFLLGLSCVASAQQASVSEPISDVQVYVRLSELLGAVESISGVNYAGSLKDLCDGGPASISIQKFGIAPTAWIRPADGLYGVDFDVTMTANVAFRGNQRFCSLNQLVNCRSKIGLLGFLGTSASALGTCASPRFGALAFGFEMFAPPALLQQGIVVRLPPCDSADTDYACVEWHPTGTSPERPVRLNARVFGFGERSFDQSLVYPQRAENLVVNGRIGSRPDVTTQYESLTKAINAIRFQPTDPSADFAARVRFDVFSPVLDREGSVVDPGVFEQLLPMRFFGRTEVALLGLLDYSFIVDHAQISRLAGDAKGLLLQLRAKRGSIEFSKHSSLMKIFDSVLIEARMDRIDLTDEGLLRPVLSDVGVRLQGLFGVFSFSFGGEKLAKLVQASLNGFAIGKLHREFDLSIPKCIRVEGSFSQEELAACNAPGLLKHRSGVRGVRVILTSEALKVLNDSEGLYLSGKMKFIPLQPSD